MPQTQDKIMQTGQVVSTLVQCLKYKAERSSSVDTSSGSVDTRDSSQNTFWPSWDSVSTLAQVVSTLEAFPEHLLGYFGTVVSTLETTPRTPSGQARTVCRH
ncbi:hypothetical protein Taro_007574 [Colocasia esculenta]|uniref:Uncharacterized protein n=1 Tax=Colocasia esculenta TaxID=4460 RepID=A0A843TUH6_COLES|nr:hypothetical protein [Colocasia esculenta]